ncbi:GATA transcription factor [Striga asiatica]|uniref:GATA transcription factor n=1 Tax=Striga asiatica TaxID=4170 RepID=A0A5A7QHP0_STRAF|nr:GATA transcription factor [Striga asiatica]
MCGGFLHSSVFKNAATELSRERVKVTLEKAKASRISWPLHLSQFYIARLSSSRELERRHAKPVRSRVCILLYLLVHSAVWIILVIAISSQPDISGERQFGQDVRTQNGTLWLVKLFRKSSILLLLCLGKTPSGLRSDLLHSTRFLLSWQNYKTNKLLDMREACKYVNEKLAVKVEKLGKYSLANSAKTSRSSKLIGGDNDFFRKSGKCGSCTSSKMTNARGEVWYRIKIDRENQVNPTAGKVGGMDAYGGISVDDLLDLPSDDFFPPSSSTAATTAAAVSHYNCFEQSFTPSFSSEFNDILCLPTEDAAELEWLSSYMDDSYSDLPPNELADAAAGFLCRPRSKRSRPSVSPAAGNSIPICGGVTRGENLSGSGRGPEVERRCTHCASEKTPQWRTGPLGPKTLCNACGVRYKSGRLVPEYRPAASPTFVLTQHSNSHRKVLELRRQKEMLRQQQEGACGRHFRVNCGEKYPIHKTFSFLNEKFCSLCCLNL